MEKAAKMTTTIYIENLKCGGCAAMIKKGVLSIDNVISVEVNVDESKVEFASTIDVIQNVKEKLSKLGYPEIGDKNTLLKKATSYVSCAMGRMEK